MEYSRGVTMQGVGYVAFIISHTNCPVVLLCSFSVFVISYAACTGHGSSRVLFMFIHNMRLESFCFFF